MTTDRTKMPPDIKPSRIEPPCDELMCKVVAKWKGWGEAFYEENDYPDPDAFVQDPEWYLNEEYKGTYPGQPDPRSDTDAALELLHEICERQWWIAGSTECGEWEILPVDFGSNDNDQIKARIPTSGEPFRRGVCWLAVDVLGVGDDTE